jgi:hypothetical protein
MEKKFEFDGAEEQEQAFEKNQSNNTTLSVLLVVFIILFLTCAAFLVYYQFYMGKSGNKFVFNWSLEKKNTAYMAVKGLEQENKLFKARIDSLSSGKAGSFYNQSSMFTNPSTGEVYCVQIGAFKSFNFNKYEPGMVNMFVDKENGLNKLIIGGFTNFEDACQFRKDLRGSGIKGVFIIKKVDGKKVPFESTCP